ncbi:hypothetical protein [Parvibaculum sp.]|nr:hypothetical protein [Parvibaculum sp.]
MLDAAFFPHAFYGGERGEVLAGDALDFEIPARGFAPEAGG